MKRVTIWRIFIVEYNGRLCLKDKTEYETQDDAMIALEEEENDWPDGKERLTYAVMPTYTYRFVR